MNKFSNLLKVKSLNNLIPHAMASCRGFVNCKLRIDNLVRAVA